MVILNKICKQPDQFLHLNNDTVYLPQFKQRGGNPYITNNVSIDIIKSKANQGDVVAQLALGLLYGLGERIPLDHKKAAYWFQKAANQGHVVALVNLGVMYDTGRGTPKDFIKAKKYFEKAISKGSSEAKMKLGIMYFLGEITPKDNAKALELFEQFCKESPKECNRTIQSMMLQLRNSR
ncbi:tetratricopeptide repeat protein [Commensalibacter nepenthis]|uniref:Tetratricopeptide repeat protein n=1 Tax=Commensalibacter nepenthis TaxID=3043872 RepID=A0ABT6Q4L5_9PROT|nr:tetratricopeptide repeat protein [Commensalibacter sp. TBRC 10068]MDI2111823.1 tetratricopeptide repeat protein [Commensalibacter sp. TBRC 10068]